MTLSAPPGGVCLFTAGALAERLGAELIGEAGASIERVGPIESADARTLTFIRDEKRAGEWGGSRAGAAIISRAIAQGVEAGAGRALLVVDDADLAMIDVLEALTPAHSAPPAGAHASAVVHESATVGRHAAIGPHVVIGAHATVGDGAVLHAGVWIGAHARVGASCDLRAHVVVEDRCALGERVILHPGVVVGADGFGYRPAPGGQGIVKIPHAGAVTIGDDVEVGANTTIDRGKFGDTTIGAGTKIDNLVQIGHNCRIGRCCIICGAVGVAGSVTIGDGATIGGGAGIRDNITIGAGAQVGARSGVMADIPAGQVWGGIPAQPLKDAMRSYAALRELPDTLRSIQKELRRLSGE